MENGDSACKDTNFWHLIWIFVHFALSLTSSKILSLDNKNKLEFILYCARLFVSLQKVTN